MFRYGLPEAALFQSSTATATAVGHHSEPVAHEAHDSAGFDEEREWDRGHVFACTTCEETVRLTLPSGITGAGPARLTAGGQTRRGGGRAMFQYGIVGGDARIEHQHADGTWASMEAREPEPGDAHDPADNDPEREWERGNVYVCTVCRRRSA